MDNELIISTYTQMTKTHNCSVDDVLETPELRQEYLSTLRRTLGEVPERSLLHQLTNLRKRGLLPRSRNAS